MQKECSPIKPIDIANKYNIAVYQVLSEFKKIGVNYLRDEIIKKEDIEKINSILESKYKNENIITVEGGLNFEHNNKNNDNVTILDIDPDLFMDYLVTAPESIKQNPDPNLINNYLLERFKEDRKKKEYKLTDDSKSIQANLGQNLINDYLKKVLEEDSKEKLYKIERILNICFSLTPQAHVTVDDDKADEEIVMGSSALASIIESVSEIYDLAIDIERIKSNNFTLENLKTKTISDSKNNKYTSALLRIVYFFIKNLYTKLVSEINLSTLSFIADVLTDMKALNSAIELYNIDQSIYYDANRLASLANSAIAIGNIDFAEKVNLQLTQIEPYHPAIKTIEIDIKRVRNIKSIGREFLDLNSLDALSGVEFEGLLLEKFLSLGFKAQPTPKTGDYGADIIVEDKEGTRFIVQCKRFSSKVNLKAVQEVIGAIGHYSGDVGIVITNNSFLNSAIELAKSHDIELWDGNKLISFLASDLSFSRFFTTKS